nr:carbonic anhydrase 4-like [Pelodiscus sinensis]|eukprot:XP_006131434.1 carbonic anhydrase 4-like [Pelodiscus sinensis]
MTPIWVQHLFVLGMLLGGSHTSTSAADSWCYGDAQCGPATWVALGQCNGTKQSPININTSAAVRAPQLGALKLTGYGDAKKLKDMQNTGKTVYVHLEDGLQLSGPGLPATYTAKSFHLHWGQGPDQPGSEHRINNQQYNLSVSDAAQDPEGIAVLAFFLQATDKAQPSRSWGNFTQCLKKVPVEGEDTDVDGSFSLQDLLGSVDLARYYRYRGSLTTPNCTEAVVWTVFPDPIVVQKDVVTAFASTLHSTDSESGPLLKNNFRPMQSLGGRQVQASAALGTAHSASPAPRSAALIPLLLSTAALAWHL